MLPRIHLASMAPVLLAALAAVPFGSLGEFRQQLTSGEIVTTVDQGRFLVARYDDNGHATWRVAAQKHSPPKAVPVYLLGGSAVRECTTSDEALGQAVSKRSGQKAKALTLASSMQGFANALAIVDNLPPAPRGGIVVIGFHQASFADSESDARAQLDGIPLRMGSKALRDFFAARGGSSGDLLVGLRQLLNEYRDKRGVPAFKGRPVKYLQHRYDVRGPMSLAAKQAKVAQFRGNMGASPGGPFFAYFDLNAALLRRCVTLARARGYQVLLMENPQDAAAVGASYDIYKDRYRPVCKRLVRQQGAHYANLNSGAGLVDADFYDLAHLLASGRAKWTPRLAAALARIVEEHDLGKTEQTASPSPTPTAGGTAPTGGTTASGGDEAMPDASAGSDGRALWQDLVAVVMTAILLAPAAARVRAVRRAARRRRWAARRGLPEGARPARLPGQAGGRPPDSLRGLIVWPLAALAVALAIVAVLDLVIVPAEAGLSGLLWPAALAAVVVDLVVVALSARGAARRRTAVGTTPRREGKQG